MVSADFLKVSLLNSGGNPATERKMREQIMGRDNNAQPSGTPTERLVWVALWHLGTFDTGWTWGTQLWSHIGGSTRSIDAAITTLVKRGVVERIRSDEGIWGYRLTLKYAQPRICPQIDEVQFGVGGKRYDDPNSDRRTQPTFIDNSVGQDNF
jgi:hypothetical protein